MLKIVVLCVTVAAVSAVGGWTKADPQDQHIQELVDFAATSLNARSNSILLRKVLKVTDAERQLVNGNNFKITFEFALSKCDKRSSSAQLDVCETYADRDQKCVVDIYESFSGDKMLKDFNCNAKPSMERRAGGIKTVADPTKFKDTALRALAMSNSALTNWRVVSAKTQVVSGQKIMLEVVGDSLDGVDTRCFIDVWSRPWLSADLGFKITRFICDKNTQTKRTVLGGVTGGVSEDLENTKEFLLTAKKALAMTNSALEDLVVVRARTQVVSGMKYYLTVEGKELGQKKQCDITVWSRPWIGGDEGFKVTNFKCKQLKTESKRGKLGGHCAGCVSDEVKDPDQYMSLYIRAFGLVQTNMDINNIKILSVKTQVVAGTKYYMKVETTEAGEPRICDVTFVVVPWMKPSMKNVNFNCKPTAEA